MLELRRCVKSHLIHSFSAQATAQLSFLGSLSAKPLSRSGFIKQKGFLSTNGLFSKTLSQTDLLESFCFSLIFAWDFYQNFSWTHFQTSHQNPSFPKTQVTTKWVHFKPWEMETPVKWQNFLGSSYVFIWFKCPGQGKSKRGFCCRIHPMGKKHPSGGYWAIGSQA